MAKTEMVKDPGTCATRPGDHLQTETETVSTVECKARGQSHHHPLLHGQKDADAEGRRLRFNSDSPSSCVARSTYSTFPHTCLPKIQDWRES